MPGFQWDDGWECTDWNVLQSCELHSIVPPLSGTVPLPEIHVKSASITPGWCNVTLECRAPGATEDLKVNWEIKGLPRELEQRVTSELLSNSWNLTLNLPLSQPAASLTCVVSNQVDQKTTTLDLGKVCVYGECTRQRGRALWELGALGFSPHHVMSTSFLPGHPFQEPGRYSQLMSALTLSQVHACLSTPFFSPRKKGICF